MIAEGPCAAAVANTRDNKLGQQFLRRSALLARQMVKRRVRSRGEVGPRRRLARSGLS
jgi:hypothetical protein